MDEYLRDDDSYFARRAREERALAQKCRDAAVARIHRDLADAYDGKLADHRPRLAIVA